MVEATLNLVGHPMKLMRIHGHIRHKIQLDCTVNNNRYNIYNKSPALRRPIPLYSIRGAAQMSKYKVLYLWSIQIRLMPSSLYNQPIMRDPMFRKIIMKLHGDLVPAHMEWSPIVHNWMIIVL